MEESIVRNVEVEDDGIPNKEEFEPNEDDQEVPTEEHYNDEVVDDFNEFTPAETPSEEDTPTLEEPVEETPKKKQGFFSRLFGGKKNKKDKK